VLLFSSGQKKTTSPAEHFGERRGIARHGKPEVPEARRAAGAASC
jgi:hypothetical protein